MATLVDTPQSGFLPAKTQRFSVRKCLGWIAVTVAALVVNLGLFGLMPCLLTSAPTAVERQQSVSQISVIRLKQPDSPVKRVSEKPPDPPPQHQAPKPVLPKPIAAKLALAFEIDPRLPAGPVGLSLPVIPATELTAPGIGEIFVASELDKPLIILSRIPPVYPHRARTRGTEGWVRVKFIVHEDGTVGSISVLASEPDTVFNDAVIRAVSGWRFQAGTIGGAPVKAWAETTVHFKLD